MEQLFIQSQKELTALNAIMVELLKVGGVDVSYRPHTRSKSHAQINYYYGCVLPLIRKRLLKDGNDFSIDDIDAFLKAKLFSKIRYNPFTKQTDKIVLMKRNATVTEMSDYLTLVINYCQTDLGLHIPASEDYLILKEIGL